jgi:ABC-2 type transport system ATP-binding protein
VKPLIHIRNLSVHYGDIQALRNLDLDVRPGAVGLLGPNGAGKTTLLRVLLGLLRPRGAEVVVAGERPQSRHGRLAVRRQVGYMPEGTSLLPGMTGLETVVALARVTGLSATEAMVRAHEVFDYVGLDEQRYRDGLGYSTGMQQRLKLAQALVHDPPVLLLDEPTNGLDPKGRLRMLDLIRDLAQNQGKSVLLCSHLLLDVERTCQDVVVLHRGEVKASGSIRDLTASEGRWVRVLVPLPMQDRLPALASNLADQGFLAETMDPRTLRVQLSDGADACDPIFVAAAAADCPVETIEPVIRSLEEVFFSLLGEDAVPADATKALV